MSIPTAAGDHGGLRVGRLEGYEEHPRAFVWFVDESGRDKDLENVHADDLFRAFASEFDVKIVPADAIVIERSEIPKVRRSAAAPDYVFIEGSDRETWIGSGVDVDAIRATALRNLALAEHMAAHPPVDEAQVEALTDLVRAIGGPTLGGGSTPLPEDFAQRLIERGVRIDIPKEQP